MSASFGWSWEFRQSGRRIAVAAALAGFGATLLGPAATPVAASAGGAPTTVIVRESPSAGAAGENAVAQLGGTVTRHIGIINGFVATVGANDVNTLRAVPGVFEVTPDAPLHLDSTTWDPTTDPTSLYSTAQTIGAKAYWKAGITGKGVDVALIDSGVVPVNGLTTPGKVVNGPDLSFDSQSPSLEYLDGYGHGTHMAGIIAGRDDAVVPGSNYAADTTDFMGIAPDARIVNVRVADSNGAVDVSQVIAALDWVVQHRSDNGLNIRVVNLSFGTDSTQPYVLDPLAYAAEVAWHSGIVVVAAVGNDGSNALGVADPADDPYLLAVGAADTNGTVNPGDDTVAQFSSSGNGVRNPDLVAPGVHIASLRDPGSRIDQEYGATATVGTRFFRGSGTSQATAVMSGAAALVIQQHPGWTPDMVKRVLTRTASTLYTTSFSLLGLLSLQSAIPNALQGNGEVNLRQALTAGVSTSWSQTWPQSQGTGTLEGSRGSLHVIASNGIVLSGEQDIFGQAWNSANMAALEAAGQSWSGGTWNGQTWSGQSWSGQSWSGQTWSSQSWSSQSWSSQSWSSQSWSGQSWSGQSWSGQSWSGQSWSGQSWSGQSWSTADWS